MLTTYKARTWLVYFTAESTADSSDFNCDRHRTACRSTSTNVL